MWCVHACLGLYVYTFSLTKRISVNNPRNNKILSRGAKLVCAPLPPYLMP